MTERRMPDDSTAPFIYTLLAYRPNGSRWFRGECVSRSDADFEFGSGNRDEIAEQWAEIRCLGRAPGEERYELTVLIDGRVACTDSNGYRILSGSNDYISEFEVGDAELYAERLLWDAASNAALKRHTEAALAAQETERLAKERQTRIEAEAKAEAVRQEELVELARLRDKYKQ